MAEARYQDVDRFIPCTKCGALELVASKPDRNLVRKITCKGCGRFWSYQHPTSEKKPRGRKLEK